MGVHRPQRKGRNISPFQLRLVILRGVATVTLTTKGQQQFAVIDRHGKYVVTPRASYIGTISEGLIAFAEHGNSGDRYGYLTADGKIAISPSFVYADEFHEGLAIVSTRQLYVYGFIDRTGKLVIPDRFTEAHSFSNGLALVQPQSHSLYGFVDHDGHYKIEPRYLFASNFINGLAKVVVSENATTSPMHVHWPHRFSSGMAAGNKSG